MTRFPKLALALVSAQLALAGLAAAAVDSKGPGAPGAVPSGQAVPSVNAVPGAPVLPDSNLLPQVLPDGPAGSELPGLPVAPELRQEALGVPAAPAAAAVEGSKPAAMGSAAPESTPALAPSLGPSASPEQSAPEDGAAAAAPGAREILAQLGDKVVPASVADAEKGSSGFGRGFDGSGPTGIIRFVQHHLDEEGVPIVHARFVHPDDQAALAPDAAARPSRPANVPDNLKDQVPSAWDKATWTGRITLHLHSVFSDGTMEPEALMQLAYDRGARVVDLSDHDTTAGVTRAWKKAKELGMEFHPGAELTARGGVHIGAVDVDVTHPKLVAHLERVRSMRYRRAEMIVRHLNGLDDLKQKGITITIDDVAAKSSHNQGGTIELPHIARVLMDKGLIKSVDEAFNTYLKGDIAGDAGADPDPTVDEVLEVVHAAGGKAFMNHPYTVDGKNDAEKDARALALLKKGFDGIEAYRPSHARSPDGKRKADERVAKYLGWADQLGLVVAPGADFHGTDTHLNQPVVWMPKMRADPLKASLVAANAKAIEALERSQSAPGGSPAPAAALALIPAVFWQGLGTTHGPDGFAASAFVFALSVLGFTLLGAGALTVFLESGFAKRKPKTSLALYLAALAALVPALYIWAGLLLG